jgi:hypothetical protein
MKTVVYVKDRDGDWRTWYESWITKGYTLMDLHHEEKDQADGRYGRAYEAQGPLEEGSDLRKLTGRRPGDVRVPGRDRHANLV